MSTSKQPHSHPFRATLTPACGNQSCVHKDTSTGLHTHLLGTRNHTQIPWNLHIASHWRAFVHAWAHTHVYANTGFYTYTGRHTDSPQAGAHAYYLSATRPDLYGPAQGQAHTQGGMYHMHVHTHLCPSTLSSFTGLSFPIPGSSLGLQPRGGWHCGEQAVQGGGRVWQGAIPPGRPWRAAGVSGAQAWRSTRWRG